VAGNSTIAAVYFVGHILTALLITALGYWIVFKTRMAARREFGVWTVLTMVWPLIKSIIVIAPAGPWLLGLELLYRMFAFLSALFFVIFIVTFTGRDWRTLPAVRAYTVVTAAFLVIVPTIPFHGLYFANVTSHQTPFAHLDVTPGLLNIAGILWVLVGLAFSYYLLVDFYRRSRRRPSSALLVMGTGIPVGLTPFILSRTDTLLLSTYNHASFGIILITGTVTYAAFRLDLADVTPVARDKAINELSDPYLAIDNEGMLIDYNEATAGLFDIEESDIGHPVAELFPTITDHLDSVTTDGGGETVSPTGTTRQFNLTTATIDGPRGDSRGSHVILRDVTALKQRESELQRQNERLDQFASVVSHDLRNPLGIAKTYLDFARKSNDEADFDAVEEAHERMDEMIEKLLTMARADLSEENTKLITLADMADQSWETVQTADATLENKFGDETVEGDPSLVQNIFENLFRNAVDHNDLPLTVTVGSFEAGFYIADDGKGIPAEDRDDIFEFGYTTTEEGSGFGMAIVQEVAKVHGWEVAVTENEDGGARFEISTN
jgi:signal transduction histidine kinase